jgi:hypothetical protein
MTRKAGKKKIFLEMLRQENFRRFGRKLKNGLHLLGTGYLEFPDNGTVCLLPNEKELGNAKKWMDYSVKLLRGGRYEGQKVKLWIERVG